MSWDNRNQSRENQNQTSGCRGLFFKPLVLDELEKTRDQTPFYEAFSIDESDFRNIFRVRQMFLISTYTLGDMK